MTDKPDVTIDIIAMLIGGLIIVTVAVAMYFGSGYAHATTRYAGQWDNIDPAERAWFKSVRSKNGVPCCDIADGHKTAYRVDSEGHFSVPINVDNPVDPWVPVPPEAIVYDAGNPYEEAVVWFHDYGAEVQFNRFYIRCFVPVGGV